MRSILGTKSFSINEPPVEQGKKGKSKWCRKTKRKRCLPVVFCVICFSILIAWVMGDIFRQQTDSDSEANVNNTLEEAAEYEYEANQTNSRYADISEAKDHTCTLTAQCKIVCKGTDAKAMSTKIMKLIADLLCSEITLIIETLYIEDEILVPDWLELDVDVNIGQLELKNSDIVEIMNGAFDMGCLYGTTSLSLNSLQVTHLNGYAFVGLAQLKELNLKNLPLKSVESYVLSPMKFSLTRFLVEGSLDKINPYPFTGSTKMHNLAIVSFDYNCFEDTIDGSSFALVPQLSSLYLRDSHITILRKEVIDSISESVKLIHLDGNKLKTIGEGVFDNVLDKDVKIYLKNNPLICDCDLVYLHDLIVSNPEMFDEVMCGGPDKLSGELVASVDVCPIPTSVPTSPHDPMETTETKETTIPTTISTVTTALPTSKLPHYPESTETTPSRPPFTVTPPPPTPEATQTSLTTPNTTTVTTSNPFTTPNTTTTTIKTTTTPPPNLYPLQCLSSASTVESYISVMQTSEFGVLKRSKIFSVSEAQEGAVEVLLDQHYQHSLILWFFDTSSNTVFPMNIEDSANCAEISGRAIRITNLVPDMTYIFCILFTYEYAISPFDCLPHKLLPTYGQRTWLTEDHKIIVISILISSILIAILIGIMATYCFINSFTSYKKACRNIPANLRLDKSATNQCYMTPVANDQPKRQRHKRSVSDTSIESCRSYVSAVVPASQFQYISWKMENRSRPSMEYYPKDPPPPPLPPHPSKRLKKQKSEIKINFQEIYDEPTSASYTSCPPPAKMHPGKH